MEEALDCTLWRARFRKGPVYRTRLRDDVDDDDDDDADDDSSSLAPTALG